MQPLVDIVAADAHGLGYLGGVVALYAHAHKGAVVGSEEAHKVEENFIINRDGATLTNWNCPTVSHFLNDVSYFLKRYFKKAERPLLTKDDIMAAYTAQNPLDDAEERALESVLRYPEKYIFVFKEFYGRHRPFAPLYVREKIDRELAALGL